MNKAIILTIASLIVVAPAFAVDEPQVPATETAQRATESTCPTCVVGQAPAEATESETKKELSDEEVQQLINELIKQAEAEKAAQEAAKPAQTAQQEAPAQK